MISSPPSSLITLEVSSVRRLLAAVAVKASLLEHNCITWQRLLTSRLSLFPAFLLSSSVTSVNPEALRKKKKNISSFMNNPEYCYQMKVFHMLRTSFGLIASQLDLKHRVERCRTHSWKNRLRISVSLSESFVNPKKSQVCLPTKQPCSHLS